MTRNTVLSSSGPLCGALLLLARMRNGGDRRRRWRWRRAELEQARQATADRRTGSATARCRLSTVRGAAQSRRRSFAVVTQLRTALRMHHAPQRVAARSDSVQRRALVLRRSRALRRPPPRRPACSSSPRPPLGPTALLHAPRFSNGCSLPRHLFEQAAAWPPPSLRIVWQRFESERRLFRRRRPSLLPRSLRCPGGRFAADFRAAAPPIRRSCRCDLPPRPKPSSSAADEAADACFGLAAGFPPSASAIRLSHCALSPARPRTPARSLLRRLDHRKRAALRIEQHDDPGSTRNLHRPVNHAAAGGLARLRPPSRHRRPAHS